MFSRLKLEYCLIIILSSLILSFGVFNVHSIAEVTEGGLIGLTLLLHNFFKISPAISGFILSIFCYAFGWKLFGKQFIMYSIIATISYSLFYPIWEYIGPVWPDIVNHPFIAAILGALFVGIGSGLCVRVGGAQGGDDALAMSISHITKIDLKWVYLFFDVIVLVISISYIPLNKIFFSLLTVILSGQIVDIVANYKKSE